MLHAKVLISTILFCSIQLLNAELVCHYDFEDSSWANRAAGSGFPDAAAKGGASFYFDEIRGSCADLTGQGWLQGGNQAGQFDALNIQLALTIWVKSSQNNWSDNNRLLGRGDYWGLEVVDNSVAGFFIKGGPLLRGKTNINDNKWHHIAACWNSQTGQRTLYVDGRLESEDIFSKKGHIEEWSWGYFSVGGRSSGYSAADKIYGGYVDDVRVYNKTLDTDEINKIFKAPVSLVRPVLPFHSKPRTPQEQALWREQRAKEFFTKLDLTVPGLRQVAYAVRKNDYQRAVDAAVRYFEGKNYRGFSLSPSSNWQSVAKDALEDRYNFAGFERKLERNEYGRIVWDSDAGTASDQYAAMLSRHYYMADILKAYKQTSQQQYLDLFNSLLRDWLDNNDYPKDEIEKTEKGKWAVPSTTQWVSLNAAIRLTSWISFWAGWDGVDVDDDVKFDMLMSIPEHCDFLRWHHRHDGNFKISEMKAICEAAIAFPEFKNASDWLEYGLDELSKEIDVQFYPDGAQKELAFHYNRIVVSKFSSIAKLAQANNIEIPSDFVARLENLYLYMAQVMKPNGYGLLNNDSDQEYIRDYVKDAASDYDNDQMRYIASAGQAGSWEKDAYSVVMPWAGQAIFRDGFKDNSNWSYIEVGPWSIGHQHYDKLHISVVVGGRDILVDAGRYTYTGYHDTSNPWRNYFTGSDSHNVILIDGLGQSAREEQWTKPLSRSDYEVNENFAFVRGVYEKGFNGVKNKDASKFSGRADHTRTMLFVPELGWVITDTIETDRPRDIEVLWHFHPDCTVEVDGEKVYTNDKGKGNLMIMPAGDRELAVDIVKGTEEPVQGWYSPRIGEKAANSTAVYRDKIRSKTTYVWLLLPDKNGVPVPAKIEECESGPENDTVRISVEAEKGRLNALIPIGKGLPRVSFLRK